MQTSSIHGMWSSRLAFILAATGSAVGLGNIWRFPYITSENGGGAFVLVYLACIVLVGLPIMFSEILIGRRGRMSPINSIRELSADAGASRAWMGLGVIGIIAGFLILSFYSVVAGWTLHYGWLYFKELIGAGAPISEPRETFYGLLANPGEITFWHGLFMLMTVSVVAFGVEKGLERGVSILMPILFMLLLILLGYGMSTGYFQEAVVFLFRPDWSALSGGMVVTALGQAFFTLSLGMCAIMTYGAYLPSDVNIPRVGVSIALADTAVALIAGLAIFPIVLAFIVAPDPTLDTIPPGGPGLIFMSLPLAFAEMPFGIFFGMAFFVLLSVAAWTSSISLMEPATAYIVEATNLSRRGAALLVAALAWVLGLASVFSFNIWSHIRIGGYGMHVPEFTFGAFGKITAIGWNDGARDIMGVIEYVAADIMLPIGGLLTALFAGWVLSKKITRDELDAKMPNWAFTGWLWLTRVVTPALILIVMASIFGLI